MRQVVPNRLWIGNVGDVMNLSSVLEAGIEALVDLALNEKPPQITRELIYCRFPLIDGGDNAPQLLRVAVGAVESLISNEIPTLVYCSAGMSRSVAVVAMALAIHQGKSPEDLLKVVASGQPHDVSPVFWMELTTACAE